MVLHHGRTGLWLGQPLDLRGRHLQRNRVHRAGIKFALIRFRPALGYDVAPRLGAIAVVAFIVIWVTSGPAFLTGNL